MAKASRGGNAEKSAKKPRIDNTPSSMSQAMSRTAVVRKMDLGIVGSFEDPKFRLLAVCRITKIAILTRAGTGWGKGPPAGKKDG
jgi:hypothetical protein